MKRLDEVFLYIPSLEPARWARMLRREVDWVTKGSEFSGRCERWPGGGISSDKHQAPSPGRQDLPLPAPWRRNHAVEQDVARLVTT